MCAERERSKENKRSKEKRLKGYQRCEIKFKKKDTDGESKGRELIM